MHSPSSYTSLLDNCLILFYKLCNHNKYIFDSSFDHSEATCLHKHCPSRPVNINQLSRGPLCLSTCTYGIKIFSINVQINWSNLVNYHIDCFPYERQNIPSKWHDQLQSTYHVVLWVYQATNVSMKLSLLALHACPRDGGSNFLPFLHLPCIVIHKVHFIYVGWRGASPFFHFLAPRDHLPLHLLVAG